MKRDNNSKTKVDSSFIRFVYGVSALVVLLLVGIFYKLYENDLKVEQEKNIYYDEFLNFSIMLPSDWEAIAPDKLDEYKVVKETTGGILFDVRGHSLKKEVVPLTLVKNSKDKDSKYSKFMTMALRGIDQDYSLLKDFLGIKDSFTNLLKKLEHTDIKVKSVGYLDNEENVVVLKGEAKLKDKKIFYTQYYEPVGSNLLIVTHGSTMNGREGLDDIKDLLSTLLFKEGGIALPTPIQEEMKKDFEKKGEQLLNNQKALVEDENNKKENTSSSKGDDNKEGNDNNKKDNTSSSKGNENNKKENTSSSKGNDNK